MGIGLHSSRSSEDLLPSSVVDDFLNNACLMNMNQIVNSSKFRLCCLHASCCLDQTAGTGQVLCDVSVYSLSSEVFEQDAIATIMVMMSVVMSAKATKQRQP